MSLKTKKKWMSLTPPKVIKTDGWVSLSVHCRVVSNAALRLHRSVLIRFRFDFDYTVLHYEMDQDVDISTIAPQVNRECKYMSTLKSKRTQDTWTQTLPTLIPFAIEKSSPSITAWLIHCLRLHSNFFVWLAGTKIVLGRDKSSFLAASRSAYN